MLRRVVRRRVATSPTLSKPPISPLIPADDFARHLTADELAAQANISAAAHRVVMFSARAEGLESVRRDVGEARAAALIRELVFFVRRNLRGTDAVASVDDELIVLLDGPDVPAMAVAQRLLAAVRGHLFTGGG